MTFFVDGNAFFTVNRDDLETTRGPWVFDHPFYLILNNAVGGDWPGARTPPPSCRSGCWSTTCGSTSNPPGFRGWRPAGRPRTQVVADQGQPLGDWRSITVTCP